MMTKGFTGRAAKFLALMGLSASLGLLAGCQQATGDGAVAGSMANPQTPQATRIDGQVMGGRQPISGSYVTAYAVKPVTGELPREIGHATTDMNGTFLIDPFTAAPDDGDLVYLVTTGGDGGGGPNNATTLLTVVGVEGDNTLPPVGTVNIDELSTVASAMSFGSLMEQAHCAAISGNTRTQTTCPVIAGDPSLKSNALRLARLVNVESGQPDATLVSHAQTSSSPDREALEKLNTLANVLAACVNAAGATSPACSGLFDATHGTADTLQAAVRIATWPGITAEAIHALLPLNPIFAPVLGSVPTTPNLGFWATGSASHAYISSVTDITANMVSFETGALTREVAGSPFSMVRTPTAMVRDAAGRHLYVMNADSNDLCAFAINADASLSSAGCVVTGTNPSAITMAPDGGHIYVTNADSNNVSRYGVDSNGSITHLGNVAAGTRPVGIAIHPGGQYLYVANADSNDVSTYAIAANGALTLLGSETAGPGSEPHSLAINPDGTRLYVTLHNLSYLEQFEIASDGSLAPLADPNGTQCHSSMPVANCVFVGSMATTVLVDPTGHAAFVLNSDPNPGFSPTPSYHSIYGYTVNPDGTLTKQNAALVLDGLQPTSMTMDPSGSYLYVTNLDGNSVSVLRLEKKDGVPSGRMYEIAGSPFAAGSDPVAQVLSPDGRYAYFANATTQEISAYRLGRNGGIAYASYDIAADGKPRTQFFLMRRFGRWVTDPTGRHLYALGNNGFRISAFSLGANGTPIPVTTGAAQNCGASQPEYAGESHCFPTVGDPRRGVIDSSGQYLYVIGAPVTNDEPSGNLAAYSIDADGALTPITFGAVTCAVVASWSRPIPMNCFPTAYRPRAMAMDPSSAFLYVAGETKHRGPPGPGAQIWDSHLYIYKIRSDGSLISGDKILMDAKLRIRSLAIDPSGRFLYAAYQDSNESSAKVAAYQIGAGGGPVPTLTLTGMYAAAPAGSSHPLDVCEMAIPPNGKYLFSVSCGGSRLIRSYAIDPTDGALSVIADAQGGDSPMVMDSTGQTLYTLLDVTDPIFAIHDDGTLTSVANSGTAPRAHGYNMRNISGYNIATPP